MKRSFVVYIDEAGDEGFSFAKGSSIWFILTALIAKKNNDLQVVTLASDIKKRFGKQKPLHFRDLKHEQRLPLVQAISEQQIKVVSILIHKPSLKEPEKFQDRYRLYFYGVRYLLERVSWYCRDHKTPRDPGDGSAEIIFSNRGGMSYSELKSYLDHLERQSDVSDVRIEWSVIRTGQIKSYAMSKRAGLQIVDAVCGSFFFALEPRHGFTESRYAQMLEPVVYQRGGLYLGYGLKFWPREVDELLAEDEHTEWVRNKYR
jgi:hypothetical protein